VDCFQLFQDVVQCQDAVNTVMHLKSSRKAEDSLLSEVLYLLKKNSGSNSGVYDDYND
jgi:hypothetical protein